MGQGRVELIAVSKAFGARSVVKQVTLQADPGEMLILVGPSGCGKSTLLRMVAGLEQPTNGEIRFDGRSVLDLPPQDRNVAMVFQNYALYPHMTVRENFEFPLRMRRVDSRERAERVASIAEMLALTAVLEEKPRALSGGQRQRVAMGRALVREPSVFLMDEPLSNLDAQLRVALRAEIRQIQRRLGVTTLYVTHDQVEAMTLGDRVAVLRSGELQQVGAPQDVYSKPANAFVASFIGSFGIAFYAAEWKPEIGALQLGTVAAAVPDSVRSDRGSLVVGVRGDALCIATSTGPTTFLAPIEHIELLGSERVLYVRLPFPLWDAKENVAMGSGVAGTVGIRTASGTTAAIGQQLPLEVVPDRLLFFDHAGKALTSG
ncbi:MAG: ABC transporter ATP-binding protein [Bdellovibrionales bacterium]|nr:ABC transporter ATP-binding protein [Bdellovibrionales bacterium]